VLRLERHRKYGIELRKTGYRPKLIQHYAEQRAEALKLELELEPEALAPSRRRRVEQAQPEERAVQAGMGVLEVLTELQGNVFIDDRLVGKTPNFHTQLPAGSYTIVVSPENTHIRHKARITIEANQTHRFELTPPPASSD